MGQTVHFDILETDEGRGAKALVRKLQSEGYTAFLAGGCVRDMIMHRPPKDFDVATDARPEAVVHLFPEAMEVGRSFGVVRVRIDDYWYEVATFRQDHAYKDGRHPEHVSFCDPETDAMRRDFTVNAIFLDPVTGEIHDFVNGRNDIADKVLRAVGTPGRRFQEDYLRMLRAVRFAGTLAFTLDPATSDAIADNAGRIDAISIERIRDELTRILLESLLPGKSIELLDNLGLLKVFLPEVSAMKGQAQPPQFHPEGDVFTHTTIMLDLMRALPVLQAGQPYPPLECQPGMADILKKLRSSQQTRADNRLMPQPDLRLAYAVLLHDVGKPLTARECEDRLRFHGHAARGAEMTQDILRRLRFSNEDIKAITFSVGNHMRFMEVKNMRKSTLRRLIGAPTFAQELELHRLDCLASHGDVSNWEFLCNIKDSYESEKNALPDPLITGNDIMAMGIPRGKHVGAWKKKAFEAQLEEHFKTRDQALEWLESALTHDTDSAGSTTKHS